MRRLLCGLIAAMFTPLAFGGYANVSPPAGWVPTGGPGGGFVPSANAARFADRAVANVTASVAGRPVVMPASMRFASNAGRVAAQAFRLNPYVVVGTIAATWLASEYGITWDGSKWVITQNGMQYYIPLGTSGQEGVGMTASAACDGYAALPFFNGAPARGIVSGGLCVVEQQVWDPYAPGGGASVWQNAGNAGQIGQRPVPAERPAIAPDFDIPLGVPVPPDVQPLVPVPLPVELPVINPSADPVPVAVPFRVPTSDPVAVPGTSPQAYDQPVMDLYPRPTTQEPWRVDFRPGVITGTDPNGLEAPGPIGSASPAPAPGPVPSSPPIEIETCGLPGKPPCKIDESGTPTTFEPFPVPSVLLAPLMDELDTADVAFTWSFALPSNCEVLAVGAFGATLVEIDLCQYQPLIHDIMAVVWIFGTIFICIGLVGRTLSGA